MREQVRDCHWLRLVHGPHLVFTIFIFTVAWGGECQTNFLEEDADSRKSRELAYGHTGGAGSDPGLLVSLGSRCFSMP